ncbi:hypothetical protein [Microbacterium yannicii]|uniref:hypothetical protein n=1 Tax=Microbacterium yannicii TaxID=671622 RepID=UPI0002FFA830|nr:hypothetical protein [Microbacterium yannicii]
MCLFGILVIVGTLLSMLRTPMSQWNTLWAEDGAVFLDAALAGSPWALFEPYAGYMHLVPRLVISVCALFPLEIVPVVVTIAAALVLSLTAAACYLFLETRIRSRPLQLLSWAVVIVAPMAGGEVANNLANLHWFLMIGAVCALIARSRGRGFAVVQSVVVIAAVGSDPLALMFLPLVAIRWFALRGRGDRAVAIAFGAAAVVQLGVTLAGYVMGAGRSFAGLTPTIPELLDFYSYRIVLSGLIGPTAALDASRWIGVTLPGVVVLAIFTFMILVSWHEVGPRYVVLTLSASSAIFFAIVFRLQWNGVGPAGTLGFTFGQRYAVLPAVLFLIAMIVAVDAFTRVRGRISKVVAIIAVSAVVLIPAARDYRWAVPRVDAVTWPEALDDGIDQCDAGSRSVEIPIAPVGFGGPTLECDLLTGVDTR